MTLPIMPLKVSVRAVGTDLDKIPAFQDPWRDFIWGPQPSTRGSPDPPASSSR
jgi:hypothetical protein